MSGTIELTTSDGVNLKALWWDTGASRSVLLLHMMPATKESWQGLGDKLSYKYNVLAIDFRGHGESSGGDYKDFQPEDHQKYILDVDAAAGFLKTQGTKLVALVGASIGANILLQYMAEHEEVSVGVCLSAGLDYYGVKASEFVKHLHESQRVLFVGSRGDQRKSGVDCASMAEQLFRDSLSQKEKVIYDDGNHGTDIFSAHPEILLKIQEFVEKK